MIAAGTRVSGRLEGAEDLDVFGSVEGSIQLAGDLLVDGDARVDATVEVEHLTVHGVLVGDVTASGRVELHSTARVVGDIVAPQVVVHEGARVRGLIDMGEPEGQASTRRAKPAATTTPARSRSAPRSVARSAPAPAPRGPVSRARPVRAEPDEPSEPPPPAEPPEPEVEEAPAPTKAATKRRSVKKKKK